MQKKTNHGIFNPSFFKLCTEGVDFRQAKTGQFRAFHNTVFFGCPRLMTRCAESTHHAMRGGMRRVRMLVSATGAEVSSTTAVGGQV